MCGVRIEIAGPDHKIFRVRSFQDQDSPRDECAERLHDQVLQCFEWQMLGNVKAGHHGQCGIGNAPETVQGIGFADGETLLRAKLEHGLVQVDSLSRKAVFRHQLQPFTTAAAEIKSKRRGLYGFQRFEDGQIYGLATFDLFPTSPEMLFKTIIEVILHGAAHLFCRSPAGKIHKSIGILVRNYP